MSKVYYVCRTVGTGSIFPVDDSLRPVLADLEPLTGLITASTAVTDIPNDRALVYLSAQDHSSIPSFTHPLNPVAPDAIPSYPLDTLKTDMLISDLLIIDAILIKYGFVVTIVSAANTYGDIITGIGLAIDPNFNVLFFDVVDIET